MSLRGAGHRSRPAPLARRPIAAGSASALPPHWRRTRARQDPRLPLPLTAKNVTDSPPPPSRPGPVRPARRNPSPRPPCSRPQRVPLLRRPRPTLVPTTDRRIPPHHAPKESCGPPTPPRPFRSARAPPGRPASSFRRRSQSLPLFSPQPIGIRRPAGAGRRIRRPGAGRLLGRRAQAVARGRWSGVRARAPSARAGTAGAPARGRPQSTRIPSVSHPLPASGPRQCRRVKRIPVPLAPSAR